MEIGELANANAADLTNDEKCPFCHEKPVGHATDKPEEVNDKVKSVPADLNCNTSSWAKGSAKREDGDLPYTLAQHHLISAMQCYAQIRRLVRMGNMVGYDINNPNNGIGLPTTHWTLKYPEDGKHKKYGDLLEPDGKQKVAYALMKELGAQWHVGHHGFVVVVPKRDRDAFTEGGGDESDENDSSHETQYDVVIIERLLALIAESPKNLCEDPKKDDKFKQSMDQISADIKSHLEKFNGKNGAKPADSSPFFVSMRAYEYSGIAKNLPNSDIPVPPASYG